ncbi:putative disease resistance protein RGA1 isoform X2 [Miscanthus floridulus]|uniref:putative disease resistance protein RGA1 isoform X2 n=1 Tax=Miscanthus floridulus TaxID=154761 RepID=UPI003459B121
MAGVLDALASYIQNMLMQMAADEVHMLLGVSGEIDNMDIKLRDLKNILADADRRNITDQSVQAWGIELRNAMYDATDVLDLCQLKAMEQGQRHDAGCFNPLLFCIRNPLHAHDIGIRIKNLNKKLDGIKARGASFNFMNLGTYEDRGRNVVSYPSGTRETSGGLDESSLVGDQIEEDTTNLVEMLTKKYPTDDDKSNKIIIFSIVGIGGIGKTTLAQKIFNSEVIKHEFTKKIWLSVNQDFNKTEMLRRVIIEAGGNHHACGNSKVALEQTLIEALKGHKTLLIMDDVWDYNIWEGVLRTPFVNAMLAQGSRVLVTTRHDIVARQMKAEEPYHRIDKLGLQDAWLLLKKQVVTDVNDEPLVEILKDIGMRLVEKCDGLPLGVKVMGGLLRQKRIRRTDWQNVLDDSLWSVSQMPKELNYAVYLSYEDLQPCLKPCFLHCSLLPRGTLFFVDDIVGMWISEGFVHGTLRDLEEIGREYYDQLIQRNLIEPDMKYVDQAVCNMHDIVRSFAHNMLGDEALIAHNSKIGIDKLKSKKFFRLSLESKGSEQHDLEWCSLQTQTSLRTLILVGNIKIKPGDSFLSLSSLRTLHLDSVNIDAVAESLYLLKHLRYLSIENSNTSNLPEDIGKLKFLQYISISGSQSLVNLPSSIGVLQDLRFLRLDRKNVSVIPREFSGLTSLRKLYGFPAHMDCDHCSLEELGPLCQLTELDIRFLENVASSSSAIQAKLCGKKRLRYLSLGCTSRLGDDGLLVKEEDGISEKAKRQIEEVFDELCPPLGLENLNIKGYFGERLPGWMMLTAVTPLGSLRILTMDDLACCTVLPSGLSQLPCLELLQIVRAPAIKRVGLEFLQPSNHVGVAFPRLHQLTFDRFVEWEEWEWEEQVKAMPLLEKFTIKMCKLRRVPPGLAFHAKALKKLGIYDVKNLRSLENFTSVVHLEVFMNTDLERISNLPKLQKLVIVKCPEVKVLEGMPSLQRLNLEDYVMETVPKYLHDVNPRYLQLDCSLSLLTAIAAGKSGPEWDKFSHIQLVKAYANDKGSPRKWYVLHARDPFRFETNISRSAIAQARNRRTWFPYNKICPIEEEWLVERCTSANKRLPLCLRFRWHAYDHLIFWLRRACLHCSEAARVAAPSNQWTEEGWEAGTCCPINGLTVLQQQNGTPRA